MKEFFHVDPVNLVYLTVVFAGAWYKYFRKQDKVADSVKWQWDWIRKHDTECIEQRKANNKLLTELQTTKAHLATMSENQEKRIDRVEKFVDKISAV